MRRFSFLIPLFAGCVPAPETSALDDALTRLAEVEATLADAVVAVTTDEVRTVSDVDGLRAAVSELGRTWVSSGATVTLSIEAGDYALDEPLVLDWPSGSHIAVVGTEATLTFTGSGGIVVPAGAQVARLDGLTVAGDDTRDTVGLDVQGRLVVGDDARVRHFEVGMLVGGTVEIGAARLSDNDSEGVLVRSGDAALFGTTLSANRNAGIAITEGGRAHLDGVLSTGNGIGIALGGGGDLLAYESTVQSSVRTGLSASQATAVLVDCTITDSGDDGVAVSLGASVLSFGNDVSGNGGYGVYAEQGGLARFVGATLTGNELGTTAPTGERAETAAVWVTP